MVSPTEETTRGYLVVRRFDSGRVHKNVGKRIRKTM